jgi:rod shape-determining protein MreC
MRNIILFFAKHGSTLLFLFLEVLCFYLIINYNSNQQSIFLHSSNVATGKLLAEQRKFKDFFSLNERVDSLQEENARLMRRVLYHEGYGKSPTIDSSTFAYDLIPAKIINQTIHSRNNYLTIDKGTQDGVFPDMGVMDQDGLIGIVQKSNKKHARILSLLNSKTRISVRVKGKGYYGNLIWPNMDHKRMFLEAIPNHSSIAVGDSIVTSGFSTMFPPEILIGTVETFETKKGDSNYNITVQLNNNFSDADYVYIIANYNQESQLDIESE